MLRLAVVLVLGVLAQQTFADEPEAIVGGTAARKGEYPHQCSLQLRGSHICGASIITANKILTAAHCVHNLVSPPYSNFFVVTGEIDRSLGQKHRVKDVTVHPGYVDDISHSWVNDIAVITLFNPIQFNEYQKPIPLTTSPPQAGKQCILSGWGKTQTNGYLPQGLLKMSQTVYDNQKCRDYYRQPIYESHLCAINQRGIGACSGDSGGPLICNDVQYGVTSFVVPCAQGAPDVYTSVYHHLDFIYQCMARA